MSLVVINWKPGKKELRQFGIAVLVGFSIIGAILLLKSHKPVAAYVSFGVAGVVGLLGLSGTRVALPVYWVWMGIAFVMGNIISRIIMAAFYYGMIAPMGLIMRLGGRDKLMLKRKDQSTYWRDLPEAPDRPDYKRQF